MKTVSRYGISGALRYVWEGDHLPPHIREVMLVLDKIKVKQRKLQKRLTDIEIMIEMAKLNSVDGEDSDEAVNAGRNFDEYNLNTQMPTLSKDLSILSNDLDILASDIDAVHSYGDFDIRRKKKELSTLTVGMMDTLDSFLKKSM